MLNNLSLKILNRINTKLIWDLYALRHKKILTKAYLILSFDCDTEEDINVALDVQKKLQDIGITPVYAVPGELLKRGEVVYSKIRQTGSQFINHGGREHTYFDLPKQRHASCFFYDQQSLDILEEDIILGHQTLQQVLGVEANGWRTPHFGTFQRKENLSFLYSVLKKLNYKFSTSTSPDYAYKNGPWHISQDIIEIPVSGIFNQPLNIMDTWAFFAAPDRVKTAQDYLDANVQLANFISVKPLLLNIYGDPSHIHDKPEFFAAMRLLAEKAESINYDQLLGIINANNSNS